jgi:hypothetical protein
MQNQDKTHPVQGVGRGGPRGGGRPSGSKARIPPGHVDLGGLADLLGLSPASIPGIERRGDPIIPPRSPLAGSGVRRRAIWRIVDVEEHIEALAVRRPAPAVPMNSVWRLDPHLNPQPQLAAATAARRPGRPRGTGKNSK